MTGSVLSRVKGRVQRHLRARRFRASLQHLHGPSQLQTGPDEVIVIALVRNGAYYLDAFFRHYRGLGVRHFVFFDNGSTDDTIDRIKAEPGTVIDRSLLPLAGYEDLIRQYPAYQYGRDRWCLYVDMDEMFDFDGSAKIGIGGLVRYLSAHGATAMVAQMLEMFPKGPLREAAHLDYDSALAAYQHYDISMVQKYAYHDTDNIAFSWLLKDNTVPDPRIQFCFGGVRGKVFGETCCLTKHPLVHVSGPVVPAPHPHCSSHVVCGDVTGVIRHYKFTNGLADRDTESATAGLVDHGEDLKRLAVLSAAPDVSLHSAEAQVYDGVEALYDQGFLVRSPRYRRYLDEARNAGG